MGVLQREWIFASFHFSLIWYLKKVSLNKFTFLQGKEKEVRLSRFPAGFFSLIYSGYRGGTVIFLSNSHYTEPEIMVFSAWMQTNHLSGRPWKHLICSTSQYSASVKGTQTRTWMFLLTHVSPPVHPIPHLLQLSQGRTGCQPLPFTFFKLLFCALVTTLAVSQT